MAKVYRNEEGNYLVNDGGRFIMLLDNGSSFEKVRLNYSFDVEDLFEIEDIQDKFDILRKAGLRK